jgi:hypothetical protein
MGLTYEDLIEEALMSVISISGQKMKMMHISIIYIHTGWRKWLMWEEKTREDIEVFVKERVSLPNKLIKDGFITDIPPCLTKMLSFFWRIKLS